MDDALKQVSTNTDKVFKTYKRRWIVLVLFFIYATSSAFHWVHYSIIASIVVKYYNVSSTAVDWTSMIFMVTYILLIVQGGYFMDKKGLRLSVLLGATLNCAACCIKILAVSPDRFWVAFIGQFLAAVTQVFVLSVPVKLAAVWFGPDQVSTACSIAVFGNQFGVAISILIVPLTIQMNSDVDEIGNDMALLCYIITGISIFVLVAVLIYFPDKPPTPPSIAQKQIEETGVINVPFLTSLKAIVTNFPLILLTLSYGIGGGVINALTTLLNQIITMVHPGKEEEVGIIGIIIFVAGTVGLIIFAIAMDKTRKYKEIMLSVYAGTLTSYLLLTFLLHFDLKYVYIIGVFQGFFMISFISVGFEFAAELSYPEPEATVGGFITCSVQLFAIIITSIYSKLLYSFDDYIANGSICGVILVGAIIMICVKSDLKRQHAFSVGKNESTSTNIPRYTQDVYSVT